MSVVKPVLVLFFALGALCSCVGDPGGAQRPAMAATAPGAAEDVASTVITTPVVNGVTYDVDLQTSLGQPGFVSVSGFGHPELDGNVDLARAVARQACADNDRGFDGAAPAISLGGGSWLFSTACQ